MSLQCYSYTYSVNENQLITSHTNVTAFEIVHVTKADVGKYTCTAINALGSTSESLSLMVDDAILCKPNEFRCKSGDQCVPKEDRCDNERDCSGKLMSCCLDVKVVAKNSLFRWE